MNELFQQIIPYRQQYIISARQCWSALALISDSVLALHTIHDSQLSYQYSLFSATFTSESWFNYLFA